VNKKDKVYKFLLIFKKMINPEISNTILSIELLKNLQQERIIFQNYTFKPADSILVVSLSNKQERIPAGIYFKEKELNTLTSEEEDVFGTINNQYTYEWTHKSKEKDCLQRFSISKEELTNKVMTKYRFTGKTENHTLFSFFRNSDAINPYQKHNDIIVLKKDEEFLGLPEGKYKHLRNHDILVQKSCSKDDYTFLRVISFNLYNEKL
jgi:hypothetical protein